MTDELKVSAWVRWTNSPIILLVVTIACAFGLFHITDLPSATWLKTTKYVLTEEMGMAFYDAPDGTEQNVSYFDEEAVASGAEKPELAEGERWLDFEKLEVDKPKNGWSKVDIGDGGAPLYVAQEFVRGEEVPMFEGRKGDNGFLTTGVSNLPPKGWMRILNLVFYFFILYPVYLFFTSGGFGEGVKERAKIIPGCRLLGYVGILYFLLVVLFKFVFGYNLAMNWFVASQYLGSFFWVILNVLLGLVAAVAMYFLLLNYFIQLNIPRAPFGVFRALGLPGFMMLVSMVYFVLIFVGGLILVALVIIAAVLFIKYLPDIARGVLGGGSASSSSSQKDSIPANNCCESCSLYGVGGWCSKHVKKIGDPSFTCCSDFMRKV